MQLFHISFEWVEYVVTKFSTQQCIDFTIATWTDSNVATMHLACSTAHSATSCKHRYRGWYSVSLRRHYDVAWWVCGTQRYCLCGISSTWLYRVDNHIKIHTEWRCYNLIIAGGDKILCTVVYIYKQPLQFATIVKVQFSTVYSILLYEKKPCIYFYHHLKK